MNKTIPLAEPFLNDQELNQVIRAVQSGWISSKGEFISQFEKNFADYCGAKYGISTSNGTTALHLALLAIEIKENDEVIVPTLTFISPVNAVTYCKATPVFVDAHNEYWGIDPNKIEKAITKKTKAIIIVHLYGHPCDIDPIKNIAKKHKIYLIEDAAEAHGAVYKNKKVGSFGDISCFSFFGNKTITVGEGGMCLTNHEKLRDKMRILKNHGMDPNKKYWHQVVGYNYRMTNIQASIGLAQLEKLNFLLEKKRKIANFYKKKLDPLIKNEKIKIHPRMPWAENTIWLYTILLNNKNEIERDDIIKRLSEKGIETRPFFYPVHVMPPYKTNKKFPVSEDLSKKGISLPSSVKLNEEQISYICNSIASIV